MSLLEIRAYEPADRAAANDALTRAFGRSFLPALIRCEQLANAHLLVGLADGRIAATASTVDYGSLGYIGMIAVPPEWRGRGFARRITERALALVPAGAMALLDASPMGAPLYEQLGFRDHGVAVVLRASDQRPRAAGAAVAPLVPADLAAVQAFDRAQFGADRGAVLALLARELSGRGLVARRDGAIAGYAFAQDHAVGPCLATDAAIAADLLAGARACCPSATPTLTVPGDNDAALALAGALGWVEDRRLRHMLHPAGRGGAGRYPVRRDRLFAYANFHFG